MTANPVTAQDALKSTRRFDVYSSMICWLSDHEWGDFKMIKNFISPYRSSHDELHEKSCKRCGKTERRIVYVHA